MMAIRMKVVCSAATKKTPQATPQTLKALNITKSSLIESQGGKATRNIDGIIFTITYDEQTQQVNVMDRVNRIEYDAVVNPKDNRISYIKESSRPYTGPGVPPTFEQLQSVLSATGPGPEIINGRIAMIAITTAAIQEIATGSTFISQINPIAALGVAVATFIASLAPAFVAGVPIDQVIVKNSYAFPDGPLPYVWSPLAEKINGRVAMLGMTILVIEELVRHVPAL